MKKFVIIADGTCDLNEEMLKELDIKVVLGHITLPDKSEISQFLSWKDIGREEFYNKLRKNPNGYTTAPPNPDMFANAFKGYAAEGCDMLVITMSSGLSATYGFAVKGRELALEEYPEADIRVIDSLNKCRYHQAGWLDDLSFVAKKGRMNSAKAFMGTLVGIKPIGEFDYNGMTTVIGKAKGAKKAYAVLLKYVAATIEDAENQTVFIAQSNRLAQAQKYKELLEETIKPKEVRIVDVFPGSGINVGPGLMAAYYMGKPISEELKEEKELINNLINSAE